jgi:glycine/D-amino acid oxidase-like deaminating enzyme
MRQANQKAEHCSAATAIEKTAYPVLQGAQAADICIVGAGFTGIAAALTLAERGYSVIVLDANRVGWGASGRNGGQLIGGISGEIKLARQYGSGVEDLLWEMRWRGNDIVHDRVAKYDISCDLKNGYFEAAIKPRHMRDLEKDFENMQRRKFPYEFRLTDSQETQHITGTNAYIGGLINMRNGHLHPLNLCIGEARAAAGLGVEIFEQSPVTEVRHGQKPRVITASGYVEANTVVLAGNAYHRLERKYLSGLVFPAGMNEVVDYYRLSADGRMLFGGRCNYSGREPRSIQKTMKPRMVGIYPELENARIEYEWGGKIGIVVNRIPLIDRHCRQSHSANRQDRQKYLLLAGLFRSRRKCDAHRR